MKSHKHLMTLSSFVIWWTNVWHVQKADDIASLLSVVKNLNTMSKEKAKLNTHRCASEIQKQLRVLKDGWSCVWFLHICCSSWNPAVSDKALLILTVTVYDWRRKPDKVSYVPSFTNGWRRPCWCFTSLSVLWHHWLDDGKVIMPGPILTKRKI